MTSRTRLRAKNSGLAEAGSALLYERYLCRYRQPYPEFRSSWTAPEPAHRTAPHPACRYGDEYRCLMQFVHAIARWDAFWTELSEGGREEDKAGEDTEGGSEMTRRSRKNLGKGSN